MLEKRWPPIYPIVVVATCHGHCETKRCDTSLSPQWQRNDRREWYGHSGTVPYQAAPCSTGRLSGSIQRWQVVYFFYIMCWYEKSTRYGGRFKVGKEVSPSSPSGMLASRSCRISAGRMRSPLFPCCSNPNDSPCHSLLTRRNTWPSPTRNGSGKRSNCGVTRRGYGAH